MPPHHDPDVWLFDLDNTLYPARCNLFAQIDVDADAALSRDEVLRYERRVRGHDFVERFDLDGDGKVTLAEFAGPTGAFRRADRSGDGTVTRSDR